jgi:hypothetical protein
MHSQNYCVSTFKSSYSVFPCAELQINSLEMKLLREIEQKKSVGRFVSNSRRNNCITVMIVNQKEINITDLFVSNLKKHFTRFLIQFLTEIRFTPCQTRN